MKDELMWEKVQWFTRVAGQFPPSFSLPSPIFEHDAIQDFSIPLPLLPEGYEFALYPSVSKEHWLTSVNESEFPVYPVVSKEDWLRLVNESGEYGKWTMKDMERNYFDHLLTALFILKNGRVVGCICAREHEGKALYTYSVLLKPHRGKGIGYWLYVKLAHLLREQGVRSAFAYTDYSRPEARGIFRKMGFKEIG